MTQDALARFETDFRNFGDALVESVSVGPRQEVTLIVSPLDWSGGEGRYGQPVRIRFGGIQDFSRVATLFLEIPSLESEIGFLGLDSDSGGAKAEAHAFKFVSERRTFEFSFACSKVTLAEAEHRA